MDFLRKSKGDISDILNILLKRDFSGYRGLAVKNSVYQFAMIFTNKFGSLLFTIILARLLMPELFGLYSLALSTIILFASFADLGVGPTLVRFVSKSLGEKKPRQAKAYTEYLFKIRAISIFFLAFLLIILSKVLAENYYHKPIYLALLAGSLYVIVIGFLGIVEQIFQASNNFKYSFIKELFFQIMRLVIVPLAVLLSLQSSVSNEMNLFVIILALALSYFLTLLVFFFFLRNKLYFLKTKKSELSKTKKKEVNHFIFALSFTIFSGIFFGYIDMIMLGRYVLAESIGFYRAAFSIVESLAPLITLAVVLFPIFNQLKRSKLTQALKKSTRITLLLSLTTFLFTLVFAPQLISFIFGKNYIDSVPLLRILALLLFSHPLIAMYSSYLISLGRPKVVAKLLIVSTLLNILLNYFAIISFSAQSSLAVVTAVCGATIISRYFYLVGLFVFVKRVNQD